MAIPDVVRSFGEDLKNVADELTAPPEPGDTLTDVDLDSAPNDVTRGPASNPTAWHPYWLSLRRTVSREMLAAIRSA